MLRILIIVVAIASALVSWGCRRADPAEQIARQAATAEQAKLWEDVGRRGSPAWLQRLAPQRPAVEARQRPQGPSRVIPPGAGSLAPGVVTGIRLVSTTKTGAWEYNGQATVLDVAGERVELGFDTDARLAFVARLNRAPLRVAVGQPVTLTVSSNAAIFVRQEILAIRTMNGAELITALKTGPTPIVLTVTLGPRTLVASHVPAPGNSTMNVQVQTGAFIEVARTGSVVQAGDLSFIVVGSSAQPAAGTAADSSPYALDITAWRAGR